MVASEDIDGVIEVVQELDRLLIILWVEGEDQKRVEIIHEVSEQLFVWLKLVRFDLVVVLHLRY